MFSRGLGIALTTTIFAASGLLACGHSSDDNNNNNGSADPLAAACGSAPTDDVPNDLVCTGLYTDVTMKTITPGARPYAPAVAFWSDGLDKDRFISLPDGTTIDDSNPDDWSFPVGTKAWKAIHKGEKKIETRFFWKVKADQWLQATYVWSDDGSKATRADGKDIKVLDLAYHVPKSSECNDCHRGRKDKLLGFEGISLGQAAATGLTLNVLAAEKRLLPPPSRTTVTLPDPAFGVLHVNCGVTCHNGTANAIAASTGLHFRLSFDDVANKPVADWDPVKTTLRIPAKTGWDGQPRVKPGFPDESLIIEVMKTRGQGQMPPIATTVVDTQGVALIEAWIKNMPPDKYDSADVFAPLPNNGVHAQITPTPQP